MKKLFSLISLFLLNFSSVLAYNPFDIITQNDPELSIADINQEYSTLNINLRVCNNGGDIDNGNLQLAIDRSSSGIKKRKSIEISNFSLAGGTCENYFVAKPQDLGITVKGNYYLRGGIVLDYSRPEKNTANNVISKNISISVLTPGNTYNNNNYYNNYNQSYYCNGTYYNNSSYSNGYYCNGTWYNFTNTNNYNNSYNSNYYYCNGNQYTYSYSDTGYNCNGTWYYRNSSANTSNQSYYCNGGRYTSSYSSGYYCNGTWYNFNNYNNSYNLNYYYCNGNQYTYSYNDTGYNCNGTWYSRNNNSGNNYNNSNYYYCNGTQYSYSTNDSGYYCNGTWYSRNGYQNNSYYCNGSRSLSNYSNGYYCNGTWFNFSSNYGVDFYIKNISYDRDTRKINSDICLNYGSNSINEYIELEFRGNGINRTVGKRINLSPGYCTTGEFSIYTEDLNLWENNSYNIEVVVKNSGNYSDSNTSNNNKYERFYIDNY